MSLSIPTLSNSRLSNPFGVGPNDYGYFAIEFRVDMSGTYALGQTQAPLDTVLIIYDRAFDPSDPGTGVIAANDDEDISSITGGFIDNNDVSCDNTDYLCPGIGGLSLTAGVTYTVVLSHFRPSDINSFAAPQTFFVYGPGRTRFTAQGGVTLVGGETVADVFERYRPEVTAILTAEAESAAAATIAANQRMVADARDRLIAFSRQRQHCTEVLDANPGVHPADLGECDSGPVTRNAVPFDVTGVIQSAGGVFETRGNFFEQTGTVSGTRRRLMFGDFDLEHDYRTGATTAFLNARIAWEYQHRPETVLGYFIGAELAQSTIRSVTMSGSNQRHGVTLGGYFVHRLQDELFADGYISVGTGQNNLNIANDEIALASDYTTRTAAIGGSLTGVLRYERYKIRPQLSFSFGETVLGSVGFTGTANDETDATLSIDAGSVSRGQIAFRPEFRVPLSRHALQPVRDYLSIAPRVMCETIRGTVTRDACGGGMELGLRASSADGRANLNATIAADQVGGATRVSGQISIQMRF